MIVKSLVAAFAVALSAPAITQVSPYVSDPRIVRVDCLTGRGSAVKVGPNTFLSVHHVTNGGICSIGGKLIEVVQAVPSQDFSIITVPSPQNDGVRIDCDGFKAGREYLAVGFARGLDIQTAVELTGTGRFDSPKKWAILTGVATVIPGQSGGAMFDRRTGKLVGMVNVYDMQRGWSGSRELKDTSVCK
jgi:hypothetical protein